MRIVISSGHGLKIRGAAGPPPWGLDEVNEARRVVEQVADILVSEFEVDVTTYHDDVSTTQNENLNRIVDFHNSQTRDLDCSVHFNAYEETSKPMGTECLYVSQDDLANEVSMAIASASGLPNRGPKYRSDLFFLNNTSEPAILIETVFVDSKADADAYRQRFDAICQAIAETISGKDYETIDKPSRPERPPTEVPEGALLHVKGACSWFGGPDDDGVSGSEQLAFFYDVEDGLETAPHLFLPYQPGGTTGCARRLDPGVFYLAVRWDYDVTPKDMLRDQTRKALVRAKGKEFLAYPSDWGPHESTGRIADLSPALLEALGLTTDDDVEVIYPAP